MTAHLPVHGGSRSSQRAPRRAVAARAACKCKCVRHNAAQLHKTRTAPCTCALECDWFTPPKQVEPPTEAEAERTRVALSGKAIAIGGDLCEGKVEGFERAIAVARAEGRIVFAARLMKLREAVRKAAIEDVEREIAERAERRERIANEGAVLFKLELPIYTKCEANARMHHMAKHTALGDIRPAVEMSVRAHANVQRFKPPFPCLVKMTRLAPPSARLDRGDNLSSALKRVRDGIADWMRLNDRSHLVDWVCEQEDARVFGVRIEIIAGEGARK